ncbi:ABC-type transport auxiliary lipoprotein family protein [Anaeromyxobacter oryzae]|uniref:ABC-type transport auxiliary lipoprotein component domain-containing protein n=1 Tax=Anaeromyxobacter oryzae TaxID=2918170 RepID=A0ABM7WPZ1_9BACT|nr:ABC-type transport auxiliary lipoprotein family protein [Anaeromyxobacter oryzae]BDG01526.1 hypothetical protein AMOR_05220 [Anaeromyxobacter oryzae]
MKPRLVGGLWPALAVAAGCLTRTAVVPQIFSIDPPPVEETRRSAGTYVVSVRRVEVAPPFEARELLYRTGDHRLERDHYAIFAAPPGDLLSGAVRGYLRNATFAREVVEPGAALRAGLVVEVYASEISGDLRRADDAAAVLRLRFVVTIGGDTDTSARGPPLLEKEYSSRTRAARRTADAIATAWNEGLSAIMKEFVADVEAVLARGPTTTGGPACR